jgi:nucleotide-binding universal stress UspA family protein
MYRHILIPTDGSELAERGVAHGLALAKSVGAMVFVINVVEPLFAVTGDFASVLDRAADIAIKSLQNADIARPFKAMHASPLLTLD